MQSLAELGLSAILMQSVGMIEDLPTKSARFFAQLCPNCLRLKHLSSCQYNEIRLNVFCSRRGRGTQVVRERSAKPLCVGSIPTRASNLLSSIG
jgi:hypothetical protein